MSAKVDNVAIMEVDSKTLVHATTGHLTANLEWQVRKRPSVILSFTLFSLAIVRVVTVSILVHNDIYNNSVGWVSRNRTDSPIMPCYGIGKCVRGVQLSSELSL